MSESVITVLWWSLPVVAVLILAGIAEGLEGSGGNSRAPTTNRGTDTTSYGGGGAPSADDGWDAKIPDSFSDP